MELFKSFCTLLQQFETRLYRHTCRVIVTGCILSQRHRYVTEVIFSSGHVGIGNWCRFHCFISHRFRGRVTGRVAPGDCSPRAPTDACVSSRAYGSSGHEFATVRYTEWGATRIPVAQLVSGATGRIPVAQLVSARRGEFPSRNWCQFIFLGCNSTRGSSWPKASPSKHLPRSTLSKVRPLVVLVWE